MPERVTLLEALSRLADNAQVHGAPLPIIETDVLSAIELVSMIARDTGYLAGSSRSPDYVGMFDGVKIVARSPQSCKHEVDGWREHFGPLAEIWS
jgi:hypothetical protein